MIVNHAGAADVTFAYVVSRRPFTGNWEYMLDQAIFTSPPTINWSGAALVEQGSEARRRRLADRARGDRRRRDAAGQHVRADRHAETDPRPISCGRGAAPAPRGRGSACPPTKCRAASWSRACRRKGPGDKAGIKVGDIILGVGGDGVRTQAEFYRKVWGRGGAGADIPLRVLQGVDIRELAVHSIDRTEYFRPKTTY